MIEDGAISLFLHEHLPSSHQVACPLAGLSSNDTSGVYRKYITISYGYFYLEHLPSHRLATQHVCVCGSVAYVDDDHRHPDPGALFFGIVLDHVGDDASSGNDCSNQNHY
jgi:hypothetical protein